MAQGETASNSFPHTPVTPLSPRTGTWAGQQEQWSSPQSGIEGRTSQDSLQRTPPKASISVKRKPVPVLSQPEVRLQEAPASPISIKPPTPGIREPEAASIREAESYFDSSRPSSRNNVGTPDSIRLMGADSNNSLPIRSRPMSGQIRLGDDRQTHSRASSGSYAPIEEEDEFGEQLPPPELQEGLQYHAFDDAPKRKSQNRVSQMTTQSAGSSSSGGDHRMSQQLGVPKLQRPTSTYTLASELRGRTLSPLSASGSEGGSDRRRSPAGGNRPISYIDLLNNVPYSQQVAPGGSMNHTVLQSAVGNAASLLDTKKTLEMYRANVKKTTDAAVQYEFAIFMVNTASEATPEDGLNPTELILEAKHILQRLADRAYPFAQYYLGDGYFSGIFNKDKPDHDKAFPLFTAASKHGHAEAGYRTALCYEFGWGTAKSYPKAAQFYRNSASKNHPGAATRLGLACIQGDMGLGRDKYREGKKWLKRAQESADFQYNAAPYELGLLHLTGYGDDIFKDEAYAAQLFTQSAELGHVEANFLMGQAYENGLYGCPRDAALSVHFYNGAASKGHAEAMMALCAWYMVGAEPVLEKDEGEAYAWAAQAAETGMFHHSCTTNLYTKPKSTNTIRM